MVLPLSLALPTLKSKCFHVCLKIFNRAFLEYILSPSLIQTQHQTLLSETHKEKYFVNIALVVLSVEGHLHALQHSRQRKVVQGPFPG